MENSVDIQNELGYNVPNTDESYEIIKMDEHVPINDTTCTHDTLIADPEDRIGDAIYHGCANEKCPVGWYIK